MRHMMQKNLTGTLTRRSPKEKAGSLEYFVSSLPPLKANEWVPVEPSHCHQRFSENALISHVRAISEDRVFTELRCKFETQKLTFFYDHEIDHLPGMLEACALRQGSLVAAHLIYGVPIDWVALLDWMNLKLFNYGEVNVPTCIRGKLSEASRTAYKVELVFDGLLIQHDSPIMNAKGKLIMFSPNFAKKVRHKKISFESLPELRPEEYGIQTVNR